MVNNINNGGPASNKAAVYQQKAQQTEQVKTEVNQKAQSNETAKSVNKDSVALTPQANQLKELQKRIGESEAFDRKKVEEIKKAIEGGEYQINYERLASKLASFEFDL
jgi:negative regulator of flagellin synthesis FlgM